MEGQILKPTFSNNETGLVDFDNISIVKKATTKKKEEEQTSFSKLQICIAVTPAGDLALIPAKIIPWCCIVQFFLKKIHKSFS